MEYQRKHLSVLSKRVLEKRKFIQIIAGPRQVGKTTLVHQLISSLSIHCHFISTDDSGSFDSVWIQQQWETARIKLKQSARNELLLVIDEIQKVKNWSETIKSLWDKDTAENTDIKVILLGSSRLLLQQGISESLAGRFEMILMGHWSFSEMQEAFGLSVDQYIWFGGYPGSASLVADEGRWKEYIKYSIIETTISRDILLLTRVDKPALLRNLFELGCRYSGQILSFNKMLGQLHDAGNTTTLSHYLDLLTTAGMLTGIEKFSGSRISQKSSSPKFQVINTGLISAQSNYTFQQYKQKPDFWGRMAESCVGSHLINCSLSSGINLYYWREGNFEVDYILEYNEKILAIEVNSGLENKTPGMNKFSAQYHPDKVLLVGPSGLSIQEFLSQDPRELF